MSPYSIMICVEIFYVHFVEIYQRFGEICFIRMYLGSVFINLFEPRPASSFLSLPQQSEIEIGAK